jgi:hypothetical protein
MRTGKHLSVSGFLVCVVALAAISLPANAQATAPNEWTWMGGSSATGSGDLVLLECMGRWGRPPRQISRGCAGGLRTGRIAVRTFGFLGAMASMPMELTVFSTTFGSSILLRANGLG